VELASSVSVDAVNTPTAEMFYWPSSRFCKHSNPPSAIIAAFMLGCLIVLPQPAGSYPKQSKRWPELVTGSSN
jgi:hypothetical protein